jgi:N-methylhydantoinase A/oxoprolinase/acetone carboxylase beta subunit
MLYSDVLEIDERVQENGDILTSINKQAVQTTLSPSSIC